MHLQAANSKLDIPSQWYQLSSQTTGKQDIW